MDREHPLTGATGKILEYEKLSRKIAMYKIAHFEDEKNDEEYLRNISEPDLIDKKFFLPLATPIHTEKEYLKQYLYISIQMITESLDKISNNINKKYLCILSNILMDVNWNGYDNKTLNKILNLIPLALTWDYEVNAHVRPDILSQDFPVISLAKPLVSAIELNSDTFYSCIIGPIDSYKYYLYIKKCIEIVRYGEDEAHLLSLNVFDAAKSPRVLRYVGQSLLDYYYLDHDSVFWAHYIPPSQCLMIFPQWPGKTW